MFAATLVLFLLPTWVLWTASGRLTSEKAKGTPPNWRTYFGWAALVVAACSTLLELIFFFSWFHNGGSPHGLESPDGLWNIIRRFQLWTILVSVVLSAFAKGWFRLLIPAWAVSLISVAYVLFMLEMD